MKPNASSLLLINASPRGERSSSRKLAATYLAAWKAAHPAGQAVVRDLAVDQPPVLTEAWIAGAYSAPEQRSPEAQAAIAVSDALVDELLAAGEIVIATPVYNFSVPGVLKLWIDQIARFGRTFSVDASGYQGLAAGRRVKVLVTSGGDLRLGQPFGAMNFVEPYLRGVFGFIGITEVEFVYAHSQSSDGAREAALAEAIETTRSLAAA
ncbi:MAG TPA: NAD(P)H-dependent oxidoreductase [Opitutaceae bacterium]